MAEAPGRVRVGARRARQARRGAGGRRARQAQVIPVTMTLRVEADEGNYAHIYATQLYRAPSRHATAHKKYQY